MHDLQSTMEDSVAGPATLAAAGSFVDSSADTSPPRVRKNIEEAQKLDAQLHELPEECLDSLALVHQNFFNSQLNQFWMHLSLISRISVSLVGKVYARAIFLLPYVSLEMIVDCATKNMK